MKSNSLTIGSWAALLFAILAWCGVALLAYELVQMQSERAAYLSNAAAANFQQGQAARLLALVRETETDRAVLWNAASIDLLTAVNAIESLSSPNVRVRVTDAQAEKAAVKSSTSTVDAVMLNVTAEGPFSALMNIMQLLETMPLATTIQGMGVSRAPVDLSEKSTNIIWTLNVRVRFLTSAQLPS